MKKDIWHILLNYECNDLVEENYKQRHNKKISQQKIRQITSSFIQAREYFKNTENAALSVRPLLLYYGVLALTVGLVLMLRDDRVESTLKSGHGLQTFLWGETLLGKGVKGIKELETTICDGILLELLEAIQNKSYLRQSSSGVTYVHPFNMNNIKGSKFSFLELIKTFPDLLWEFKKWIGTDLNSLPVNGLQWKDDSYNISIPSHVSVDKIQCFMSLFKEAKLNTNSKFHVIEMPISNIIYLAQLFNGAFDCGDIYVCEPISDSLTLAVLPSLYCASYYLGMLARYYPSIWMSLGRVEKGDSIFPLIHKLLSLIKDRYPELIVEFLHSPYSFELKNQN